MTTPEPTTLTIKGAVTESHMEDDVRVIDGIRVEAVVVRSAQSLLNLLTGASMEAHTAARHPFTYPECEMYPCEQARAALATPPAALDVECCCYWPHDDKPHCDACIAAAYADQPDPEPMRGRGAP